MTFLRGKAGGGLGSERYEIAKRQTTIANIVPEKSNTLTALMYSRKICAKKESSENPKPILSRKDIFSLYPHLGSAAKS